MIEIQSNIYYKDVKDEIAKLEGMKDYKNKKYQSIFNKISETLDNIN